MTGKETMMHRHHDYVDHAGLDHNHGSCSEHAHWAGGSHDEDTPLEVSTPENDPLGHPQGTGRIPTRFVAYDEFGNLDTMIGMAGR